MFSICIWDIDISVGAKLKIEEEVYIAKAVREKNWESLLKNMVVSKFGDQEPC